MISVWSSLLTIGAPTIVKVLVSVTGRGPFCQCNWRDTLEMSPNEISVRRNSVEEQEQSHSSSAGITLGASVTSARKASVRTCDTGTRKVAVCSPLFVRAFIQRLIRHVKKPTYPDSPSFPVVGYAEGLDVSRWGFPTALSGGIKECLKMLKEG